MIESDHVMRKLTKDNIDKVISEYRQKLKEIPLVISSQNLLELMSILKRQKIGKGPYPNVSMFEAANRIMTDLVLLNGIRMLLDGAISEIDFKEYIVEYGNENANAHDITASENGRNLKGEVFNVAESYFKTKKAKSLKKLREGKREGDVLLLIFNKDAVPECYEANREKNEFHLIVDIKEI